MFGRFQASILKVLPSYLNPVDPTIFDPSQTQNNYSLTCKSSGVYLLSYPTSSSSSSSVLSIANLYAFNGGSIHATADITYSGNILAITTDSNGEVAYLTSATHSNANFSGNPANLTFGTNTVVYRVYDGSVGFGVIYDSNDGQNLTLYTNVYFKTNGSMIFTADMQLTSFSHYGGKLAIKKSDAVYYSQNTSLIIAWDVIATDPISAVTYSNETGIYVASISVANWSQPSSPTSWVAVMPDSPAANLTLRKVLLTTDCFAIIGMSINHEAWLGLTSSKLVGVMSGVSGTTNFTYTRFTFDGNPQVEYITEFSVSNTVVAVFGWNYDPNNQLFYAASTGETGTAIVEDQLIGENIQIWGACGYGTSVYTLVTGTDLLTSNPFTWVAQLW